MREKMALSPSKHTLSLMSTLEKMEKLAERIIAKSEDMQHIMLYGEITEAVRRIREALLRVNPEEGES
ncbi:MAG: hypothetical protein AB1568_06555 [Thermodesulfobacteriota bacterium]